MNHSRRFLRLALIFLSLSLSLFMFTMVFDASASARFYAVGQRARDSAVKHPIDDPHTFLEGLPQPTGWVSYYITTSEATTPWSIPVISSIQNPRWESPLLGALDRFGLLNANGGTVALPQIGSVRYNLHYSYMVLGPLVPFAGVLFWMAFWVMLALWLYQDAKVRLGKQSLPWLALGLVGGPIAIAIWLIQRPSPPPPPPVCPACRTEQVEDATYCVACGTHLKPTCPECGRAIELGWKHCPTCGNHLDQETA